MYKLKSHSVRGYTPRFTKLPEPTTVVLDDVVENGRKRKVSKVVPFKQIDPRISYLQFSVINSMENGFNQNPVSFVKPENLEKRADRADAMAARAEQQISESLNTKHTD